MSSYRQRVQAGEYEPKTVESKANIAATTGHAPNQKIDYSGYTLLELQELAKTRELPFSGTKAEITQRLTEADNA